METNKKMNPENYLLPGCMFIGIGIGFIFNAIPVGIMIGLGTGFLLMGIIKISYSNKRNDRKSI
jgi:hypothetical protein